jgi:outer membrane protein TolC
VPHAFRIHSVTAICRRMLSPRVEPKLNFSRLSIPNRTCARVCGLLVGLAFASALRAGAQSAPQAPAPTADSFQGSIVIGEASPQPIALSLDDAIQRGLKTNLGIILNGTQTDTARAERLSQLQSLLPSIDATGKENVNQVDLPAEGLRFPGFPKIIGPFSYTDVRASLSWSLVDVSSLRNYLAARHNFAAAQLTAEDARDMVVLTVGNAYLLVLADQTAVSSAQAQVDTSKVSLDQAVANHQAGTAPQLDELRARVDYQTQEQQLIASQNALEKDKLALARTIGLPLAQQFTLSDSAPYAVYDQFDINALISQARANRKDLAALVEQEKAAQEQRKAATAERFPTLKADADYGDIGTTLSNSHGTVDATGTVSVPVFKEFGLRGDAQQAQAQLDTTKAQLSDRNAQVEADVRDALLDIQSAQKEVKLSARRRSATKTG